MSERSNEIIKQLNRLTNDHSLAPRVRAQILDAVRYIKDIQANQKNRGELYIDTNETHIDRDFRC